MTQPDRDILGGAGIRPGTAAAPQADHRKIRGKTLELLACRQAPGADVGAPFRERQVTRHVGEGLLGVLGQRGADMTLPARPASERRIDRGDVARDLRGVARRRSFADPACDGQRGASPGGRRGCRPALTTSSTLRIGEITARAALEAVEEAVDNAVLRRSDVVVVDIRGLMARRIGIHVGAQGRSGRMRSAVRSTSSRRGWTSAAVTANSSSCRRHTPAGHPIARCWR